jgi:hypothetical protein
MKKWILRLCLLAVLIGGGLWGWRTLFPSPEQVIRRRLTEVARAASFPANQGALARLADAQSLTAFCTPDVEINVDVPGHSRQTLSGQDELLQAIVAARTALRGLNVEFFDILVTLAPDRSSAVANLTAKAQVPAERDFYVQEIQFNLRQTDGKWLIVRAETVRALSPTSLR